MTRRLIVRKASNPFLCLDCHVDTHDIDEYYMLQHHIWRSIATKGMLCIGCVEKRLGRTLTAPDFMPVPLNFDPDHLRSERLVDRMTTPGGGSEVETTTSPKDGALCTKSSLSKSWGES